MTVSITNAPGRVTTATITPTPPLEMVVPFQLTSTGAVAGTTDPVQQARQHIVLIAMTEPGERVMRPTYGGGLASLVFENDNALILQTVLTRLQTAFAAVDTNYTVVNVSVSPAASGANTVIVAVDFQMDDSTQVYQALFDSDGNFVGTT